MNAEFFEPTKEDYIALAERWRDISGLVRDDYGYELNQSRDDLQYLQRVINDETIDPNNGYATECLGVAFGRVMASNEEGLDWWVVVDQYGREIVIRYRETSIQLDALHLIGKRLEDGEQVDVGALYDGIMTMVNEIKSKGDFR